VSLYAGEEEIASPWPAFADLLSATTLLFLILFAALAVPALQRVGETDALESTLTRIDTVLSAVAPERGVTVQRVGDYVLVRIPGEATFSVDRFNLADLRPGGKSILREFGRFLRQDTILRLIDQVQVVGHTSREGSDEHNWVLSASRAATVSLFLIDSAGIPACQVSALGRSRYYPADPAQARATHAVDPADRRIELEIRPILPRDSVQRMRRGACVEPRE
jgi:outer membrane protein OmpA-like peptidoglycan-associated protein